MHVQNNAHQVGWQRRSVQVWQCLLACAAIAGEARGQVVDAQPVIYSAEFFAPFAPQTALDMVERVPGFSIDEGEERRGFAGAQSNVLIDGEAPTAKSQEIDDVLARIPASDVVRIELIRSSSAGSGQAVRVNVVRRVGGGTGVWTLEFAHAEDGRVSPSGEAAYSERRGDVAYGLSAVLDVARFPIRGERFDFDAFGALDERRIERLPIDEREARLAGDATMPLLGGEASFNTQLARTELDERFGSVSFDASGATVGTEVGDLAEGETVGEIGASLRRDFGAWRTEWTTVITRRRFEAEEIATEWDGAGVLEEMVKQTQRVDSGETIVRASGRRELSHGWRLDLGAEAALNTLEQRLSLTEDNGGGPVPVPLPSANVRVEEVRGEASAMLAGPLAPRWTLEAGAAIEASQLGQSGDAAQETELSYWKPTIQIVRALGARNQLRVRLYRDVAQLDFEDFVAAADIQDSVVSAGNPDLRPETSWRIEAAGDWRFGEDGAFGFTLYRWAIEDALDIVPVGPPDDRFDAPGNIGDAALWGARAQLAVPLPASAELQLEAMAQRTEATDPLTGATRPISESEESTLAIEFRQDLASFAWGLDYEREIEAPSFRLERVEEEQDAEDFTLWVETTAFAGLKLRAWASNLTDSAETRERRLFDPDRLGVFEGADTSERRAGVTVGVSASGRF